MDFNYCAGGEYNYANPRRADAKPKDTGTDICQKIVSKLEKLSNETQQKTPKDLAEKIKKGGDLGSLAEEFHDWRDEAARLGHVPHTQPYQIKKVSEAQILMAEISWHFEELGV